MVSPRSARIGPKLRVDRTNVPVAGSKWYVNPDAGEGSGTVASWLVSATFMRRNSDWNALLKCAAWLLPSSCTSSLFSTSPCGP